MDTAKRLAGGEREEKNTQNYTKITHRDLMNILFLTA